MSEIRIRKEKVEDVEEWHWLWVDDKFESGSWAGPSKEVSQLREKVMPLVKGKNLVLAAGGCQGLYPRIWSKYFKQVVAVEPSHQNFEVMEKNCVGDNFRLIHGALGERAGRAKLYLHDRDNVGMHSMTRRSGINVDVDVYRIDDLNLPALDLLQLDIEGGEGQTLLGGYETISKFRPVITVETVDNVVEDFMLERKYKCVGNVVADRIFVPI